jgi:hypothetical protein
MSRIVLLPEPSVRSEPADDYSPFFDGEGYATHGKSGALALHKALDDNDVRLWHGITAKSRAVRRPRGPFTC